MPGYPMQELEKFYAFQSHIRSLDANTAIFSTRFYHPLQEVFQELERQLGKKSGPHADVVFLRIPAIKPFQSVDEVKALIPYANRLDLSKYNPCFRCLVDCWGKARDYVALNNVERLIRSAKSRLDASKGYACSDARQFPGVIAPGHLDRVLEYAKQRGGRTGPPRLPRGGIQEFTRGAATTWNADHLAEVHGHVQEKGAGECTSFGYFAAHILKEMSNALNLNLRIEVVSWGKVTDKAVKLHNKNFDPTKPVSASNPKNVTKTKTKLDQITVTRKPRLFRPDRIDIQHHYVDEVITRPAYTTHVFCVVNRAGGTADVRAGLPKKPMKQLPNFSEWGRDCWVVDPWLASMGYDSAWPVDQYPKKAMLDPVYQEMDSLNMPNG